MNWGYKIVVVFVVFASMIGYMVYRCFGTNFELVESAYYKSELKYQEVIDGTTRANSLSALPALQQRGSDVLLLLPDEMKNRTVSGSVLFYCAYDSRNDKRINLKVDNNGVQLFSNIIRPGLYHVKVDWHEGGKNYFSEKQFKIY